MDWSDLIFIHDSPRSLMVLGFFLEISLHTLQGHFQREMLNGRLHKSESA